MLLERIKKGIHKKLRKERRLDSDQPRSQGLSSSRQKRLKHELTKPRSQALSPFSSQSLLAGRRETLGTRLDSDRRKYNGTDFHTEKHFRTVERVENGTIHTRGFRKSHSVHRKSLWSIHCIADIHCIRHIRVRVSSYRREKRKSDWFKVWSKAGLCDVWILILTGHRLGHEEDNNRLVREEGYDGT